MKQSIFSILVMLMVAVSAMAFQTTGADNTPVALERPERYELSDVESERGPAPGEFIVSGEAHRSTLLLNVQVKQARKEWGIIEAVKVYSLPSGTFLAAIVGHDVDRDSLRTIWAAFEGLPLGMATSRMDGRAVRIGIKSPVEADDTIYVEYLVKRGKEYSTEASSIGHFDNLREFGFRSTPVGRDERDTGYRHCGVCGPNDCGCIFCGSIEFTLCCPDCEMQCGYIICP